MIISMTYLKRKKTLQLKLVQEICFDRKFAYITKIRIPKAIKIIDVLDTLVGVVQAFVQQKQEVIHHLKLVINVETHFKQTCTHTPLPLSRTLLQTLSPSLSLSLSSYLSLSISHTHTFSLLSLALKTMFCYETRFFLNN